MQFSQRDRKRTQWPWIWCQVFFSTRVQESNLQTWGYWNKWQAALSNSIDSLCRGQKFLNLRAKLVFCIWLASFIPVCRSKKQDYWEHCTIPLKLHVEPYEPAKEVLDLAHLLILLFCSEFWCRVQSWSAFIFHLEKIMASCYRSPVMLIWQWDSKAPSSLVNSPQSRGNQRDQSWWI